MSLNSLTLFKDPTIDPEAVAGLNSLFQLQAISNKQLSIEAKKTQQVFEQYVEKTEKRHATLAEENLKLREQLIEAESRQRKIELLYESQIKALEEKNQLTEKALQDTRLEMGRVIEQAEVKVKAANEAKVAAVNAATMASEARVKAIKEQIRSKLDRFYFPPETRYADTIGHWFHASQIASLAKGDNPECHHDCHGRRDPNNYFNRVYERWKLSYLGNENWHKLRYDGEYVLRMFIATVLMKLINDMKQISD